MKKIVVKHIATQEVNDEDIYLEKVYSIDGKEIICKVERLFLNPLRFLEYALVKKN